MTRPIFIKFFCFTIFLLMPFFVASEQLSFSKKEQGESYQFNYEWVDQQGETQSIEFLLAKRAIFDRFRNFRVFKPEMAKLSINKALQKKLRVDPIKGVMIDFNKNANDGEIKITGRSNQAINAAHTKIYKLKHELSNDYLTKNYYTKFITHDRINAVKPDHVRFASITSKDLKPIKPIILEKFSIKNIRKITNYVLGFVQSIPYSTLESRVTASGAGFSPPLKLLWENQGDCDSKVALTASILRTLMPRIKMTLVFIDNHALIGIEVPVKSEDQTITIDKISYVLAEPTGPGLFDLGKIAAESELAIGNGHYITELFHAKGRTKALKTKEDKRPLKQQEKPSADADKIIQS